MAFLLTWIHAVLAGTDGGALLPLYLATGLAILAGRRAPLVDRTCPPAARHVRPRGRRPVTVTVVQPAGAGTHRRGGVLMSGELRSRIVRRTAVLALTLGVIAAGVVTVGVAAQWRAESAPIDTAPVAMSQIDEDFTAEVARANNLSAQVSNVALEVAVLRSAVDTAASSVTGDTTAAKSLEAKLAKATAKYEKLQAQLKVAQKRLETLNAAAARQAALNRQASSTSSSSRSSGGGDDDDHEDDEDEEDEEDDDD